MLVWVLKDGEHLPIQVGSRKMRTWMLADALHARGHQVAWWSSTFSHQRKSLLVPHDEVVVVEPGFDLRLLHAGAYERNVSLARYLHHRRLGRAFRAAAERAPAPDVIVTAFPPIEFAYEAVRYARERGIPTVVDVRDLWPDTFVDRVPSCVRPFARAALAVDYRRTRAALGGASGIVAISQGCLDWGLRHAGRNRRSSDGVFPTGYPDDAPSAGASPALRRLGAELAGKVVFTFIGIFGQSYELSLVCRAARSMWDAGDRRSHFVLAGDGERRSAIDRVAATLPNVTLTGWLLEPDLRALLSFTHVGLVPVRSVMDAMPNKVFEFLSAGVPVISSVRGEMELLLAESDAGLSYAPGDARELARLASMLATAPERRSRMGRRARALFESRFRASAVYGAYAEHVERVALEDGTGGDAELEAGS